MMKKIFALLMIVCLMASCACAVTYETEDGRNVILGLGGSFVYARDSEGVLRVWGDNQFGQLGKGNVRQSFDVVEFQSKNAAIDVNQIRDIIPASDYSFLWMEDGTLWGVGNNSYLPLTRTGSKITTHVAINIQEKPAAMATGFGHVVLLTENGDVYTWGRNSEYQVGNGKRKHLQDPYKVDISNVVQIAAGGKFTIALDADGQLWGWGDNEHHAISPDKAKTITVPTKIDTGDIDIAYIDACGGSIVLLDTEGTLWTWGRNDYYQLGYDTKGKATSVPKAVDLPGKVTYVAAYSSQTYAVLEGGEMWSWGNNSYGQLGQGFRSAASEGVLPGKCWESGVVMVQGGSLFCVAMLEDGTVLSAGISKFGQLGEGGSKSKYTLSPNGMDLIVD